MKHTPEISRAFVLEAIERLPLGFAVFDAEQRLVWCNDAFAAFQEEKPSALIGETAVSLVMRVLPRFRAPKAPKAQWQTWIDAYWSGIARRKHQPMEVELADGTWFLISTVPLPSGGIAVVRTDITEQKNLAARYRDIAEGASDWTWEMDADLRFTFIDDRAQISSGNDPKRAIGRRRDEIADTSFDPENWRQHLDDMAARRPFRDFIYRVQTDAGVRFFRTSGKPILGIDGEFHGYRGTASDITSALAVEHALRDSETLKAAMIRPSTPSWSSTRTAPSLPSTPRPSRCWASRVAKPSASRSIASRSRARCWMRRPPSLGGGSRTPRSATTAACFRSRSPSRACRLTADW